MPTESLPSAQDLRTTALGIPVLNRHPLQVVLCLGEAVTEESRLDRFSHDMRHPVLIAVNRHATDERVFGSTNIPEPANQ